MKSEKIKVFAHLAYGQDLDHWARLRQQGKLIGSFESTPYGYDLANEMGCEVTFSKAYKQSLVGTAVRYALRGLLGFDLAHALSNSEKILESDVVWTHTESQYLAVAMVFILKGKTKTRPKLLGQSVWFFDTWQTLDPLRKAFYRHLIKYVDCMTVHSPLNLEKAREIFPLKDVQLVRYGIKALGFESPYVRQNKPHRLLCMGNDRHRDWKTVIGAFGGSSEYEVTIFSTTASPRLAEGSDNIEIRGLKNNEELQDALMRSSLLVLPLKENLHASGATVVQQAVAAGLPVVASNTGGLHAYFAEDEIEYVEPQSPQALRTAVDRVLNSPDNAIEKARRAQLRMTSGEIGVDAYIRDHVRISQEMLER